MLAGFISCSDFLAYRLPSSLEFEGEAGIVLFDDAFEVGGVDLDIIRVGAGIGGPVLAEPGFLGRLAVLFVLDQLPIIVGNK